MENRLVVAKDSKGKDRNRCKVSVFIYSRGINTYMCKRHISRDGSLISWLWWWMHKDKQVINYMVPSTSPPHTYTNVQVKLIGEVWIRLDHCMTINKLVLIYYNFANISIVGKWVLWNFSLHYFLLLYGLYSYLNKHFNKVYKELESYSLQTLNVRNLDDYMKMRKYILEIKEYYQR